MESKATSVGGKQEKRKGARRVNGRVKLEEVISRRRIGGNSSQKDFFFFFGGAGNDPPHVVESEE